MMKRSAVFIVAWLVLTALLTVVVPGQRPVAAQSGGFGGGAQAGLVETIGIGSQPTAATAPGLRRVLGTTEGITFARLGGSNQFTCRVTAVTAATQCQAAPGAGLKAYVTDMIVSNNVATAQTIKIQTSTGASCASPVDLSHAVQFGAAVGNFSHSFHAPLNPPAAAAVCITPSAATSISATVTGFIAP